MAAPLVAALILFYFAVPWLAPVAACVLVANGLAPPSLLAVAAGAWMATLAGRVDASRRYGLPLRGAWLAPLGACVIAWIALRSAYRAATGRGFDWKGRTVT